MIVSSILCILTFCIHFVFQQHFTVENRSFEYRLLAYETQYCFSAKAQVLSLILACHASEWQCLTTSKGKLRLDLILLQ